MSERFQPGDVVEWSGTFSGVPWPQGVIAYQGDAQHCYYGCGDSACRIWGNILFQNGRWGWDIPECQLRLSDFGQDLREG